MKIFISGGTGFVGGHVIRELRGRGHDLCLLTHRRGPTLEGVEQVAGDVTRPETFRHALQGCQAAINLVGIIREFPSKNVTFERLHVQATAAMLEAAQAAGVRRFLQMSALGTRPNAYSNYHISKYRAEMLVRASGLEWTILPSIVDLWPQGLLCQHAGRAVAVRAGHACDRRWTLPAAADSRR